MARKRRGDTIGNRKVAIIGDGFVGPSIAYALAIRDVAMALKEIEQYKEWE